LKEGAQADRNSGRRPFPVIIECGHWARPRINAGVLFLPTPPTSTPWRK
jgi:hypothetical protein